MPASARPLPYASPVVGNSPECADQQSGLPDTAGSALTPRRMSNHVDRLDGRMIERVRQFRRRGQRTAHRPRGSRQPHQHDRSRDCRNNGSRRAGGVNRGPRPSRLTPQRRHRCLRCAISNMDGHEGAGRKRRRTRLDKFRSGREGLLATDRIQPAQKFLDFVEFGFVTAYHVRSPHHSRAATVPRSFPQSAGRTIYLPNASAWPLTSMRLCRSSAPRLRQVR